MRWTRLVALAAVSLLAAVGRTPAQSTYTWNLDAAGTWDTTAANWLLGVPPAGSPVAYVNGANTAAFGNVITANRTITVQAAGVTASSLQFSDTGPFAYTLATNTINLNAGGTTDATIGVGRGSVGTATYSGTGGNLLTAPLVFANNLSLTNNGAFGTTAFSSSAAVTGSGAAGLLYTGQGNTAFSGAVTGFSGGVTKSGTGTLNLTSGSNTFGGPIAINAGVLGMGTSDASLGNAANGVTVAGGAALRFTGSVTSPRAFTVAGTAASPSRLDLASGSTVALTGSGATAGLVGAAGSAATVSVTNGATAGTLSVEGAQPGYSGSLTVGTPGLQLVGSVVSQRVFSTTTGATLRLQNAGTLPNVSSLTLSNGSGLTVANGTTAPAQNLPDRLPNGAGITSNGGRLLFTGPDSVASGETLGAITGTGMTTVTVGNATTNDGFQTINLGALTLNDKATLYVRGLLGGAAPSATVSNLFVTGGLTPVFVPEDPTGVNGPASGAGTGTLTGVVPFIGASTSNTSNDPRSFATYDANGLRTLLQTDTNFFAQVAAGGTMPDFANIHATGSPADIVGTKVINSLAVTSGITVGGTGTLRIHSGAIATFNTFTFNGPTIDFGAATGYFHSGFGMNVAGTSSLTGSGGFVAGSLGTSTSYRVNMTNTVPNPFTGGLFVNGNLQVTFQRDDQLGAAGGNLSLGGGQLLYVSAGTATLTGRAINVNASNGTIGATTATSVLEVPGLISGAGQVQFGGGTTSNAAGVVALTGGANTYTGGTVVSSGILQLSNVNQLGTGPVYLNGGTLQPASGTVTFATTPTVVATGSTFDTPTGTAFVLSGGLAGSGGTLGSSLGTLNKTGPGTLTIGGSSTYAGTLNLSTTATADAGTVTISGAGAAPELGAVTVGRSGVFNVDDSTGGPLQRTGRSTNLGLTNTGGTATTGGSTVNLTTAAGGGSRFVFGTLSVTGGAAATPNTSTLNLIDGGSGNNTVTFLGLTAVAANNALNLVGTTNFGIDVGPSSGTRMFFQTAPALTGGAIPNVTFTGFGGTGQATYDSQLGVVLLQAVSGTFIDNIQNVGPGSVTPTGAAFTTTGATTANLGAAIKSLGVDGHTVTLVPNVRTPQTGNLNTPADTLLLTAGGLTASTSASTITSASATKLQFGALASILTNTGADLTISPNVTLVGAAGLTKSGAATLTVNGPNQIVGLYTIAGGTLNLNTAATTGGLAGTTGTVNLAAGQPLTLTGSATSSFTGVLGGSGTVSLPAAFTGQQTLGGANTFAGAFNIAGGTLVAGSASALGADSTSSVSVTAGGTLAFTGGGAQTINAQPVSIAGTGATGRFGAIDNLAGTNNTFNGPVTLSGPATIGATAGTLTLGGGITVGGNALTFAPQNGATINLNPAVPLALNLGTGQLTVNGVGTGTLVLPNTTNTMSSTMVTGGNVQVADIPTNLGGGPVTLNGGGLLYSGPTVTLTNAEMPTIGVNGGTIGVTTAGSTVTLANTTFYTGPLTKTGPGTLQLPAGSATLTPNQPLAVLNGTFDTNGNSLAVTTLTLGTIGATTAPALLTPGGSRITLGGNVVFNAPSTPTVPISADIDLGGATRQVIGNGFTNAAAADLVFSGVISGNGGITMSPGTGSQTWVAFTGANTFTGAFTHNSTGTMFLAAVNTFQPTTPVVISAGGGINLAVTTAEGGLVVGSYSQAIGSLSSGGTGTGGVALGAATLTVGGNNQSTSFSGVISGTGGSLVKVGTGTLTLTGANTYTGTTTVNGGTLRVNGSTAAASAVTVTAGGAVGGSGTINGATTLDAGGVLAPGNSIGTLTVNNTITVVGSGSPAATVWQVELNGVAPNTLSTAESGVSNVDRLVVTGAGNLDLSGVTAANRVRIDLSVVGGVFSNATDRVYYQIAAVTGSGTISGFDPAGFEFSGPAVAPQIELSGTQFLVVSFVPVPEPATVLAVSAAGLAAVRLVRRRWATA